MEWLPRVATFGLAAPAVLMCCAMLAAALPGLEDSRRWRVFSAISSIALIAAAGALALRTIAGIEPLATFSPGFAFPMFGSWVAVLVQCLGTVIGVFSGRYLEGEGGQRRYLAALAGVLASVHLLLLADHWITLIAAWALVGVALEHLLCFYRDRPFALLAAFKKRLADRVADALLIAAALLAWRDAGSGSLSALWAHVEAAGGTTAVQASAVCLVLAVALRTALLPVHGWLIQVMEAPTPVSALLHAGVVNLGGFVLIRFAPLLEHAPLARWLLAGFGLGTAVLAGLVMVTRVSIKVRLAWSTAAQMGFMVLECGLGLYTLAALHLIGHSLYKAHAFLSASDVVRHTRERALYAGTPPGSMNLLLAPVIAAATVLVVQRGIAADAWPWWWSLVLAAAWAPLLWLPGGGERSPRRHVEHGVVGALAIAGLTACATLAHRLPFGTVDLPDAAMGMLALAGMAVLHGWMGVVQWRPRILERWRRWSYAGLYLDESYTRLALALLPARWSPAAAPRHP